jgi:hypothetical protein
MDRDDPASFDPRRLQIGDRARVECGPLAGVEGTVAKRCNGERLILALKVLQSGISLEIDERHLAAAD